MNINDYMKEAVRTAPDLESEKTKFCFLLGLAGEAGEVVDYMKKVMGHGKPFDKDKLIDELGDVHWYMAAICAAHDIDPSEVLTRNVEKLRQRYPNGFNHADSNQRNVEKEQLRTYHMHKNNDA